MKITAQEEYGLRCLVQLARLDEGETLTLPQIAEKEGISQSNAGKLMWTLSNAGLVKATRGAKGGYKLDKNPADLPLNVVIKVLDNDQISGHCDNYSGVQDSCVHMGDCGIRSVILGVHEVVEHALSNITLADVIGSEEKVDERFHRIEGLQISPDRKVASN